MEFGIVNGSVVTVYECPKETVESEKGIISAISDELLYGMGVAITGTSQNGYVPVKSFYGYSGFVRKEKLCRVTLEDLKSWEGKNLMVTNASCVDVLSLPRVQGVCLVSLLRGAMVNVLAYDSETPGWAKVELTNGSTGYLRSQFLSEKKFSQSGLWEMTLPQASITDEWAFRKAVTETAEKYLGVQYRWGGRSSAGIDCSGLTSISYLLNGILTYRDAQIKEGYPVKEIPMEQMKPGDLLYFPGHIAMYLGDSRYIHSSGRVGSGGVVINSLNPTHEDYREDLVKSLYAVGSIF